MSLNMLTGLIRPFVPAIVKALPAYAEKIVVFFKKQNIPLGTSFCITVTEFGGKLYAIPGYINDENKVTQHPIEINGQTYKAVELSELLTTLLNKA